MKVAQNEQNSPRHLIKHLVRILEKKKKGLRRSNTQARVLDPEIESPRNHLTCQWSACPFYNPISLCVHRNCRLSVTRNSSEEAAKPRANHKKQSFFLFPGAGVEKRKLETSLLLLLFTSGCERPNPKRENFGIGLSIRSKTGQAQHSPPFIK